jgi:hypothetical protein
MPKLTNRKDMMALTSKQEGHDGPEIADLYKGPRWAKANFKPGLLFEQTW